MAGNIKKKNRQNKVKYIKIYCYYFGQPNTLLSLEYIIMKKIYHAFNLFQLRQNLIMF